MPKFNLELKWNDASEVRRCPLTGVEHKPWIGMHPFLAGSNEPVAFEPIAISDPVAADEMFTVAWDVQRSLARLNSEPTPVVPMQVTLDADLLSDATREIIQSVKRARSACPT